MSEPDEEVWAEIPDYSGYLASTAGRIMGPTGKVLSQRLRARGKKGGKQYFVVSIRNSDVNVHRLVLLAFIGKPPPGMQCRHLDDDIYNNKLENLRWGYNQDNFMDAILNGRIKVLTPDKIDYIRNTPHMTVRAVAVELGVSKSLVHLIRTGQTWKPELQEALEEADLTEPIL